MEKYGKKIKSFKFPLFFVNPNPNPNFNTLILSVPDELYSRNVSCTLNLISTFLYQKFYHDILTHMYKKSCH